MPKYLENLEVLRAAFSYDPVTGNFYHKKRTHGRGGAILPGYLAGTLKDGYIQLGCQSKQYRAHMVAWVFMTGSMPLKGFEIDHENRDRSDNRWSNLRLVTRSRNNHNSGPSAANKSGVKGVSWVAVRNKWLARLTVGGKIIHLGEHTNFDDAVRARTDGERHYLSTL